MDQRRLLLTLMVLAAAPALCRGGQQGEGAGVLARPVRWRGYPSDVRRVKIDRKGRAWFEIDATATVEQIKQDVEQSKALSAPWVRSARIMLFDSAGRIWLCLGSHLLLAYDPAAHQWIERQAIASGPSAGHEICGPAVEDSGGRVFIGDRGGCHVFDHGAWTYQPFYDLNVRSGAYFGDSREFYIPNLVCDDRGRVYAWTTWGAAGCTGTLGFWVHQAGSWRQMATEAGERPGHISAVVPLFDNRLLVCPEAGAVYVTQVDTAEPGEEQQIQRDIESLAALDFRVRRDAERRILERGPHIVPLLDKALRIASSAEQHSRLEQVIAALEQAPRRPLINDFELANARLWGKDAQGNVVLWADTVGPDGRAGRTAAWLVTAQADVLPAPEALTQFAPQSMLAGADGRLFMAHYQKGLAVLTRGKLQQLTENTDLPLEELLGRDRDGRVYAQSRWQTVAVDSNAPETRRTLPTETFELSASRAAACLDSRGRMIAKLFGQDHPFLSRFEDGQFKDIPLPAGARSISDVVYLQPMAGSALAAQEEPGGPVFYFDGTLWAVHRSMREMVERNYQSLIRQIDNRRSGPESDASLRLDAQGNIWCVQWDHLGAYDGRQWQSFPGPASERTVPRPIACCLPLPQGPRVLLCYGGDLLLAKLDQQGITAASFAGLGASTPNGDTRLVLRLDSRGRVWLPGAEDSATVIEADQPRLIQDSGLPRLEDSIGRIWFVSRSKRKLVILKPDGTRTDVPEDALSDDSTIVEGKGGSYWINTRRGLRHLVISRAGLSGFRSEGDYYERGIPKGGCNGIWIDAAGALWFCCPGRLYRIALP